MVSRNGRRLTVRFDDDFYGEVESYQKLHKIKTWVKALHVRDKENLQRIKELENNGFDKKDAKLNGGQPLSESEIPSKEQFLKSIKENNPPYELINPLAVECFYHAYNPQTKQHFCEEKKIDPYACMRRHQRFKSMKRRCVPVGRKKNNSTTKSNHTRTIKDDPYKGYPKVNYDKANPLGDIIW